MPQHIISAEVNAPLDEDKLARLNAAQVSPLVGGVEFHAERLTIAIRVLERSGNEIVGTIYGAVVTESEGPVPGGMMNGAPKVNDLEAVRKKLGDILSRKMAVHTCDGRLGRLVDVHQRNRLALLRRVVDFARATPTDR